MAAAEHLTPLEQLSFAGGLAVKMASTQAAPAGRLLVKAAHACLNFSKLGHTAPAMHLKLVSEQSDWGPHCVEVAAHVSRALSLYEPMHKRAFSGLSDGLGTLGRGVGYGSLGAGAGAGALFWLLSRHANQEAANLEATKNQVDYYHRLSHDLHDSMRRKYQYQDAAEPAPKKPRTHAQ